MSYNKGQNAFYTPAEWNAVCQECGMKFKASQLKKHWKGYWVCPRHWEPREAQDFVKAIPDNQTPPWTQPRPADIFIPLCTPNTTTAISWFAVSGCAISGYRSPMFDPSVYDFNVSTFSGT